VAVISAIKLVIAGKPIIVDIRLLVEVVLWHITVFVSYENWHPRQKDYFLYPQSCCFSKYVAGTCFKIGHTVEGDIHHGCVA